MANRFAVILTDVETGLGPGTLVLQTFATKAQADTDKLTRQPLKRPKGDISFLPRPEVSLSADLKHGPTKVVELVDLLALKRI